MGRPGSEKRRALAKGNDGNYLQHSVEVAIALQLVAGTSGRRLHIALAHGMAPYEACGALPNGQARRLLQERLEAAQKPAALGEPSIVAAYLDGLKKLTPAGWRGTD